MGIFLKPKVWPLTTIMKIIRIATIVTCALTQESPGRHGNWNGNSQLARLYKIRFYKYGCEDFHSVFENIEGVDTHCTSHAWKKNWRCNLKCTNGFETPWSDIPIK